jgi:hypothetical protein
MTTNQIRERLQEYIRFADDKKVEAIYTIVENEINEELDLWNDQAFLAELDKRLSDFENNRVESSSWDDVKAKSAQYKR